MIYNSTRNDGLKVHSLEAVLQGIAQDGGLYMCKEYDNLYQNLGDFTEKSDFELSQAVMEQMLPEFHDLKGLVQSAYQGKFEKDTLAPLKKVGELFAMELFHGPTCAFKDVALCVLPHLLTQAKKQLQCKAHTLILTATSGDTGKAALEGFKDVEGEDILVFYPDGGVSEVQKLQMSTAKGQNVHVCAVRGDFDDAQNGVKEIFHLEKEKGQFKQNISLSSANSINLGRLVPQITYYFTAYRDLLLSGDIVQGQKVNFVVPTGNFGDILAGYLAKKMGLPIEKLVCASNENNVLTTFLNTGLYDRNRTFKKTISPSMDILVSSNLERLLYLLTGADNTRAYMQALKEKGAYQIPDVVLAQLKQTFLCGDCTEKEILSTIKETFEAHNYLMDTHSAVAFCVAKKVQNALPLGTKTVVLCTASPYKFSKDVLSAFQNTQGLDEFDAMQCLENMSNMPIPPQLQNLKGQKERFFDVIEKQDMLSFVQRTMEEMP